MEDGEWISITDAAARLRAVGDAVDRSSLSRYLKQHSEALPLREHGRANLVDFDALVAHRGENIRLRQAPPAAAPKVGASTATRFGGSQSEGAARKAQADAELREMDLAQRKRQLTPTPEVDQAGRDAVALMLSAYDRATEAEAQSVSLKYGWDERTARIAFKAFARAGLEVFHREMLEYLDRMKRSAEAGEPISNDREATALQ